MKLEKQLNTLAVFSIGAGAMISSGLFVLPALAYRTAGAGIILAYFLAGLLMLPALFSQLELATAIPKAGGTYFFLERILGSAVGTAAGVANWFSIALKSALALVGIGIFATIIFPDLTPFQIKMIALGACIFFALANLFSVEASGFLQIVMVIILLTILAVFVIAGYPFISLDRIGGAVKWGLPELLTATGMVFISYGGITKIASISEEAKNPTKSLVRGGFAAFIVVQVFYMLVVFIVTGVMDAEALVVSLTPVTDAAGQIHPGSVFSRILQLITAGAGMLAFITTANAGIMSASRVPLSMSRDSLLPGFLGKISEKRKTPVAAILTTTLFMVVIILFLEVEELAKTASLFMLLLFLLINLSVIVIRTSRFATYKPAIKSPFYPVIQIAGMAAYIILIALIGVLELAIAGGIILASLLWYFVYGRKRVHRKSALIHMIQAIAEPERVGEEREFENELLEILFDRDEITEDRFDRLIREAPVIDFQETVDREECFRRMAEIIGEKWNLDPDHIVEKLNSREAEASTLIYPGVALPHAVPHVVLEGEKKFDIILIRNRYGIKWSPEGDVVYTAFGLVGTKDEREFHLRALMSIAQVLQDSRFHEEWHAAKTVKELRTVILLAKRRRQSS
ncbi:MAG: amino acid permease [Spirochaetia bacterium]